MTRNALLLLALALGFGACPRPLRAAPGDGSDPAAASYVDSRGRTRLLRDVPDRVLVAAGPGALDPSDPALAAAGAIAVRALGGGGRFELRFDPGRTRDPVAAARDLAARGRVARVGRTFTGPDGRGTFHLDREVVVTLRAPAGALSRALMAAAGLRESRPLDRGGRVHVARAADAEGALAASRVLAGRPEVAWAVPDFIVPYVLHGAGADPLAARQWHLRAGAGGIDAEGAWALVDGAPGRAEVTVAVVDTGLDVAHPEFAGRVLPGWDTLDADADPSPGGKAIYAHGTHCAGLAGAARDGAGVVGVCPGCRLLGVRFMEGFSLPEYWAQLSTGAEALRRAADLGADVLSNSWGIYSANKYPFRPDGVDMAPLLDAARYAAASGRDGRGAVVVFSSGNERGEPMAADDLAALPEVIAVGATGPDDAILPYSQGGPNLALTAPSNTLDFRVDGVVQEGLVTTDTAGSAGANKGDGAHYTSAVLVEKAASGLAEDDPTGDTTRFFNGTSASAPLVAGTAALVLAVAPDLSPAQVRRILEATADRPAGGTWDGDGHDDRYGHGRLNARRAVAAARFGLGTAGPGDACADDANCASGPCARPAGADLGTCGGEAPPDAAGTDVAQPDAPDPDAEAVRDAPGPARDGATPADTAARDAAPGNVDAGGSGLEPRPGRPGCGTVSMRPSPRCRVPLALLLLAGTVLALGRRNWSRREPGR